MPHSGRVRRNGACRGPRYAHPTPFLRGPRDPFLLTKNIQETAADGPFLSRENIQVLECCKIQKRLWHRLKCHPKQFRKPLRTALFYQGKIFRFWSVAKFRNGCGTGFGENVGTLTHAIFGLEVTDSGFHKMISEAVDEGLSYEEIVERFGDLGDEARGIARSLIATRGDQ